MNLLQALLEQGALRALDHAFAQALRRLDPTTPDDVLAAAALTSLAVSAGHAAFDLHAPGLLVAGDMAWPGPEAWLRSVAASRLVAQPGAGDEAAPGDAPLVLEHGLLSDHALAADLMAAAATVADDPFPADQLNGAAAVILDPDMIGPEPAALVRLRLFRKVGDGDPNRDVGRGGAVREEFFHPLFL